LFPSIQNMLGGGLGVTGDSSSSVANLQLPQPIGSPQYDPNTNKFNYAFNVTNPLATQIQLNQFSADVVSSNGTYLGNVSIDPITLASGANAVVNVTGTLDQSTINELEQGGNLDISLANITVNMGGVTVNLSHINDIGSIQTGGP